MSEPLIEEGGKPFPSFLRWETFLSLGLTAGLLTFLVAQIDFDSVLHDLAQSDKTYILLGFLAHYATYPVRGLRWRYTLGDITRDIPARTFGLIVFFYNAVDNVVPAKLGDLYAAHMARINFRIRRSSALGSIVFLRLIDAWIVFLLAGVSSWFAFSKHLPEGVAWVLGGGFLLALIVTATSVSIMLIKHTTPSWVPSRISEMIEAFHDNMWPARKDWPPILSLTVIIWSLETLWIFCLIKAFGVSLSLPELIFLTQIPLLASAFPLTPSGAGAVEITLFGCLQLLGVPASLAASITVLNRLIDYWLHIGLGGLVWAFRTPLGIHTLRERYTLRSESD
ncbi:MAG: lysylphosphatidylglycerol synthase transmembrane domain-containing protein [Halioglobus sp.]